MPMRTHELHPALVHAPLTLLPMAAATDVAAVLTRSKRLDRMGRALWLLACGSAAAAGLAGMAAAQQVEVDDPAVDDMMYLHGSGNVAILAASTGLLIFRMQHRATLRSAAIGVGALMASSFTAYLGGEMVYRHGVGVGDRPPKLFSREAPGALARDAVRGAGWLARRTAAVLSGGEGLRPEAVEAEPAKRLTGAVADPAQRT